MMCRPETASKSRSNDWSLDVLRFARRYQLTGRVTPLSGTTGIPADRSRANNSNLSWQRKPLD